MSTPSDTREAVRQRYAQAALDVLQSPGQAASCCGGVCCGTSASDNADPITGNLYGRDEVAELPPDAVSASLGCGNPTALAELAPGEVVLDLGSGGGIDVLLSAKRVGPTGKANGLDTTDEMLALTRANADKSGATNVEFLRGQIEAVPPPDHSVDVVISNCVINLSTDKGRVLREAYRVLKPGGRFAVSDVVVDGPVPESLRRQVELWVGCVAGALERDEYARLLGAAGFEHVTIEPARTYDPEEIDDPSLTAWLATQPEAERARMRSAFMSAFVRARKPPRA